MNERELIQLRKLCHVCRTKAEILVGMDRKTDNVALQWEKLFYQADWADHKLVEWIIPAPRTKPIRPEYALDADELFLVQDLLIRYPIIPKHRVTTFHLLTGRHMPPPGGHDHDPSHIRLLEFNGFTVCYRLIPHADYKAANERIMDMYLEKPESEWVNYPPALVNSLFKRRSKQSK